MNNATLKSGEFTVIAVCRDHESVERVVHRLHREGFDMRNLSVVGRDFKVVDKPVGFVTTGDCATAGAEIGAFVAGLFGICVGMAFLIVPGIGPVIVAGPLSAALLGGAEASTVGGAIGAIAGALVGWGVPGVHVAKYETLVKGGKFLILARGESKAIEHAKSVLAPEVPEDLEIFENGAV